jgi:hypothetical protein
VLPLADGRCDLSAIGERRFAIEELDTTSRPYLMATVRWLAETDGQLSAGLLLGTQRAMQRHRSALARLNVNYAEPDDAPTDADPATGDQPGPTGSAGEGASPAGLNPTIARALSYAVARQTWLPLADRQRLLACPDTASRLREARVILRRESELVSQLHAVPVTAAAFRS